jgi:hypothetical protein
VSLDSIDHEKVRQRVEDALAENGVTYVGDPFGLSQAITLGVLTVLDELAEQVGTAVLIPTPNKGGDDASSSG